MPAPPAPPPSGRPTWSYVLLPGAILVAALIVATAVLYTRRDPEKATPDAAPTPAAVTNVFATPGAANQPATLAAAFRAYGAQAGIDDTQFVACLADKANAELVNSHLLRGGGLGVDGTPTFFINNKRVVGDQPWAIFEEVINAELAGSPKSLDGYSAAVKALAAKTPPQFEILASRADITGAHIEGDANAPVMVAEYSDFQCPFCKRWVESSLPKLRAREKDGVALAFLHFPIVQIHPNAGYASLAAACAGRQGKFWPMHDLLFARQTEWQKLPAQ